MENIVILRGSGIPVKLTDKFSNVVNDIEGPLTAFTYENKHYRYYFKSDFRDEDEKIAWEGYYDELQYLDYIQHVGGDTPTISVMKSKHLFNFAPFTAKTGESITVNVMVFNSPYTAYHLQKRYTFELENQPNTNIIKRYINLNTAEIIIPANHDVDDITPTFGVNHPRNNFYKKNLGDNISGWSFPSDEDAEKKRFARTTTLIALKSRDIVRDIFPKLTNLATVDSVADNPSQYDQLSLLDKLIFTLKKSWGYYYQSGSSTIHRQSFDAIMPPTPIYAEFYYYYNGLVNFYNQTYVIQDILKNKTENERLRYLLNFITHSSLTIVPYDVKIGVITDLMKKKELYEEDENFVIKLVHSLQNDADQFLDFLLQKADAKKTNFETLYYLMDDRGLSRIPIISWFVTDQPNRKYFTFTVYELWKNSKYNFYHIPSSQTANDDGMNPGSYFLTTSEGITYFEQNFVLNFSSSIDANWFMTTITEIYFTSSLHDKDIKIDEVTKDTVFSPPVAGPMGGTAPMPASIKRSKPFGNFHLYQPIALVGYEPDLEMIMPETAFIPAFLFYYVEEFDKLKDFDAGISLALEIGVEAALFYFTGGLSAFRHLRHLKHVTKIGKAMRGLLNPTESVTVWRGLTSGAQVLSTQASVLMSASNYIATTTNNQDTYELAKGLSRFFLYLTLASATASVLTQLKAANAADEVLAEIDNLSNQSIPHNLDQEILDILNAVKNTRTVSLTLFRNKLSTLNLGGVTNRILSRYDNLLDIERVNFWRQFSNATDADWLRFNKEYLDAQNTAYTLLDIWKSVEPALKNYRKSIDLLEVLDWVYKETRIDDHILKLEILIDPVTNGVKITGGHHIPTVLSNLPSGYTATLSEVQTLLLGFRRAKVTVNIPAMGNRVKKLKSTLFPDFWTAKRIKEEVGFAMWKAGNPSTPGMYTSYYTNGVRVKIIMKTHPTTGKTYFDNILSFEYTL